MKARSLFVRALFVATCALAALAPRVAAQDVAAAEAPRDEARRLFEQGTEALRAERIDDAVALLSRSHALLPNVANGFNLAVALQRGGRVLESLALLERLAAETLGALDEEQRAAIAQRIGEGRRAVATLRVSVTGARAEVSIDDAAIGVTGGAPLAREVDPGEHRVTARAGGFVTEARTVDARAGATTDVELTLRPDVTRATAPALVATEPPRGDDAEAWAWALGTIGVLAIGGAIALGIALSSGDAAPVVDPVTGIGETLTARGALRVSF